MGARSNGGHHECVRFNAMNRRVGEHGFPGFPVAEKDIEALRAGGKVDAPDLQAGEFQEEGRHALRWDPPDDLHGADGEGRVARILHGIVLGAHADGVSAVGLFITVLALILAFYVMAFSMILTGWLSAIVLIIRVFSPEFLEPYMDIYPILPDPTLNTLIYVFVALLIAALGLGMLWLGTRMLRGVRFVLRFLFEKIRNWRKRTPAPAQ